MRESEFIAGELEAITPYVRDRWLTRRALDVRGKTGANDLLTEVDLEVQRRLVSAIERAFPKDSIVAEEAGMDRLPADRKARCWFIDPVDGTQNFVRGMFPEFGVSLAFADGGEVRAGGVAMAGADIVMLAERGGGATRNGERMAVSGVSRLDEARIDIDFGYPDQRRDTLKRFSALICHAGQFRSYCAAVMGLCSVACGETDAYAGIDTQPWDSAAGALLVEEAGGRATNFEGVRLNLVLGPSAIVVSNGRLHDSVLARIGQPAATRVD
jgi:myo-inositol-1(or 4)-monophosphatase